MSKKRAHIHVTRVPGIASAKHTTNIVNGNVLHANSHNIPPPYFETCTPSKSFCDEVNKAGGFSTGTLFITKFDLRKVEFSREIIPPPHPYLRLVPRGFTPDVKEGTCAIYVTSIRNEELTHRRLRVIPLRHVFMISNGLYIIPDVLHLVPVA